MLSQASSKEAEAGLHRLLLFNLATDRDDPILGFTTGWIRALARHADHLDVITMKRGRLEVPKNVRVFSVGKELGYGEPRRALLFYRLLRRLLRENNYDACFAHMMPLFAVMGAPLLKARGVPLTLWYVHSAASPLLRLAERLVDTIVTASDGSFPLASAKVVVAGHGIDTALFSPPAARHRPQKFTILVVGRIAPIKRIDIAVEAVHLLISEQALGDVRLRCLGPVFDNDKHYKRAIDLRTREVDMERFVQFLGPVPYSEIMREYWKADIVLSLSPDGLFDKAPLEAMSCGVPVVTSNQAFRHMLNRVDATLFVENLDVASVASACRRLHSKTASERRELGEALSQIVKREHSLESLALKLAKILPAGRGKMS